MIFCMYVVFSVKFISMLDNDKEMDYETTIQNNCFRSMKRCICPCLDNLGNRILVTCILGCFLGCVTGQLLCMEIFLRHSVWLRKKCCGYDLPCGVE